MLRRGLHGAYELAAPTPRRMVFRMRRESPVPSTLSYDHTTAIPFFIQKKGDQSVLDQIESPTLRGGLWTARTTDNPFNINHLLPPTMSLVGGNLVA
jgi:hypothetical protein